MSTRGAHALPTLRLLRSAHNARAKAAPLLLLGLGGPHRIGVRDLGGANRSCRLEERALLAGKIIAAGADLARS